MVGINATRKFSKVFLRFGQIPYGGNADAEPLLEEISLIGASISNSVSRRLNEDDVLSLGDSYGDATAGDPCTFDFLRVTTSDGIEKEIEVFNMVIMIFMDNREETRRLFRIINAIKGEQGGGGQAAPRPETK